MISGKFRAFSVVLFVFLLANLPCTSGGYLTPEDENAAGSPVAGLNNYTGPSDLVFDPVPVDLLALTEEQKKLSTDLLQLTDESFLPPGMTREVLVEQMEGFKQIAHADDIYAGVYDREGAEGYAGAYAEGDAEQGTGVYAEGEAERDAGVYAEEDAEWGAGVYAEGYAEREPDSILQEDDLVYVYVQLYPGNGTGRADHYVDQVTDRDEENHLLAAWVRVGSLETLASLESVKYVRTVMPPVTRTGTYTTAGDAILNCDDVRALYNLTGEGVRIGIISNGVDNLADAVVLGDLPANVTVLSNTIGGNEGTAMLEIVHDLAPGAELYFHDSGNNVIAFNTAVDALAAAGCTIICDDIGWILEPYFEDGIVASHVQAVVESKDILYVSAAGNDALSHYQGEFDFGIGNFHDFSGGTSDQQWLYGYVPPGGLMVITLQWNDKWGFSANDYNLYLGDLVNGSIVSWSTAVQDGNDAPQEGMIYLNTGTAGKNVAVLVQKVSGDPRVLEVFIYSFFGAFPYANNLVPEDSVYGHPAARGVVSVGAIGALDPGNDDIELYSSRGPVSIYHPSFELRNKTEISGIDGVRVSGVGGFPPAFFGTSASATHIAGLAGLVWSGFPEKSAKEIREALFESAVDLGDPGRDETFGYGRADALAMYETLNPPEPLPVANFSANLTEGPAPLAVSFTDLSENASFWAWDVDGDNVTDYTDPDPVHTYIEPGLYTVSLTVNNTAGSDTLTKPGYINVTEPGPDDWNPWNDPDSPGGADITLTELQDAVNAWLTDTPAPGTGAEVTLERLQELINLWLVE